MKRFMATATNAIQLQEEATTQASIPNSLILTEGSKRGDVFSMLKMLTCFLRQVTHAKFTLLSQKYTDSLSIRYSQIK